MNVYFSPPEFSCGIHQLCDIVGAMFGRYDWMTNTYPNPDFPKGIRNILREVNSCEVHYLDDDDCCNETCAYIMFSDAIENGCGRALARHIKKHKLGAVVTPKKARNPNSGKYIEVFIWTVDWTALAEHVRENEGRESEDRGDVQIPT